jgi:hypothetical protein
MMPSATIVENPRDFAGLWGSVLGSVETCRGMLDQRVDVEFEPIERTGALRNICAHADFRC